MGVAMRVDVVDDTSRSMSLDVDYMNLGDNGDRPSEGYITDYPFRTVSDRRFGQDKKDFSRSSMRPIRSWRRPLRPAPPNRLLKNAPAHYGHRSGDKRPAGEAGSRPNLTQSKPDHETTKGTAFSLAGHHEGSILSTSTTKPRPPQGMTWKQQFVAQIKIQQAAQERAYSLGARHDPTRDLPYQIRSLESLNDDDVMNGIAAMRQGLEPGASDLALGTAHTIRSAQFRRGAHNENHGSLLPVVGWPKPLMIPLRFTGEESDDGFSTWAKGVLATRVKPTANLADVVQNLQTLPQEPNALSAYLNDHANLPANSDFASEFIRRRAAAMAAKENMAGHYVLVVAEKALTSQDPIMFSILNSATSIPSLETIRRAAQDVVRHSGWPPSGLEPVFGKVQSIAVPQQSRYRSGIHVILNAWAYMLQYSFHIIPTKRMNRVFYHHALQVINLALSGHLNAETLRAFFHAHGFAYQRLDDAAIAPMHTYPIYQRTLEDTVKKIRQLETEARNIQLAKDALDLAQEANNVDSNTPATTIAPPGVAPIVQMLPLENLPRRRVQFDLPPDKPTSENTAPLPPKKAPADQPGKGFLADENRKVLDRQRAMMMSLFPDTPLPSPNLGFSEPRQPRPHRIRANTLLDEDDMHLAIAALTQGINSQHGSQVFAFGLPHHFQTCREPGLAAAAHAYANFVGGPQPLIMPLIFNSQDVSLGEGAVPDSGLHPDNFSGHNVVAFAERIYDPESPVNVQLTFFDSAEGNVRRDRIVHRGETIIRNSHWLGRPATHPPDPVFGEPNFVCYPRQRNETACGLHVILNAWVFALGDLRNNKAFYPNESFYRQGVEVVNLAMAGCTDSITIRAWLLTSRYALMGGGDGRECDKTVEIYDLTTLRDLWQAMAEVEDEEEQDRVIQQSLAEAEDDREVQKAIEESARDNWI
ncbi:MAG: hypothetical protein M1836_006390 [Candelina mexicana]|nr:MAG: hypothetical protein M1836_006390 [Candelina mexicana]